MGFEEYAHKQFMRASTRQGVWLAKKYKLGIDFPLGKWIDPDVIYAWFINEYLPSQGEEEMQKFLDSNLVISHYLIKKLESEGKRPNPPNITTFVDHG